MIPLLENKRPELASLCRRFGVKKLDVFGSAASGDFDPARSDVDLIASFADTTPGYADRFLSFAEAVEVLLAHPVDLLTDRAIRNPAFRQEVERLRQCVYEQRGEEAIA